MRLVNLLEYRLGKHLIRGRQWNPVNARAERLRWAKRIRHVFWSRVDANRLRRSASRRNKCGNGDFAVSDFYTDGKPSLEADC